MCKDYVVLMRVTLVLCIDVMYFCFCTFVYHIHFCFCLLAVSIPDRLD